MDAPPQREPSTGYAWYVVGVLTLASISGNVDQQVLSLLVRPIERDFGITDVQMSYLLGLAFALFFAVLGLPIARLADRSNRRNIMATGVGLWSVFTTLCASARTFGRLFALRMGVGVGEATLNAPGISLLADYFPRERLGRAMGVYSLGIFLGSGVAYFLSGVVVGLLDVPGTRTVPLLGDIRPWQSVFLAVGLPGFLIALLFLTVREPVRRGTRVDAPPLPLRVLLRYVRDNRRTFATHSFGFAMSGLVNFALVAWLPTFFLRTYGMTESATGKAMGLMTMSIGVVGVLAGGWAADWFVARGQVDGPLRVGIIGAVGMLVSTTALALMPTAGLALVWLGVVNFFAAFPWGAASAAVAEIVPAPLRAQGAALYFFVLSLVSRTVGPTAVAWCAEHVFSGRTAVGHALATVNVISMSIAIALFLAGLGSYRATLARRERWTA